MLPAVAEVAVRIQLQFTFKAALAVRGLVYRQPQSGLHRLALATAAYPDLLVSVEMVVGAVAVVPQPLHLAATVVSPVAAVAVAGRQ